MTKTSSQLVEQKQLGIKVKLTGVRIDYEQPPFFFKYVESGAKKNRPRESPPPAPPPAFARSVFIAPHLTDYKKKKGCS